MSSQMIVALAPFRRETTGTWKRRLS